MSEKYRYSKIGVEKTAGIDPFRFGSTVKQTWNAAKPVIQNIGQKGLGIFTDQTQANIRKSWGNTKTLFKDNVNKLNDWGTTKGPESIRKPWEETLKGWRS